MIGNDWQVIDEKEPRGQSVAYKGIPCTARHCCTNLNRMEEEIERLKSEINEWKDKYYEAESSVIYEYSSNIREDMKELYDEVYGNG